MKCWQKLKNTHFQVSMMLLYDEGETFVEGVIDAYSNSAKNINNNV